MPQLRKDAVSDNWVVVSSERGGRPNDYRNSGQSCPFCPGEEKETPPEIFSVKDSSGDWKIRVFPNKYPALTKEKKTSEKKMPVYRNLPGFGIHEVVVESRDHNARLEDLPVEDIEKILGVYADRCRTLRKEKGIKHVMVFKNYGSNAGASLRHPHSQIIAMPFVPTRMKRELSNSSSYFSRKRSCVWCDMIKEERVCKKRIVADNGSFVAFEPFASRFSFETWILPVRHECFFEREKNLAGAASVLKETLLKLSSSIENLSYNMIIHSAPDEKSAGCFHWHIELLPKLAMMAGFEWGSGFYINSVSPEEAAEILKKGVKYRY